MHAGYSFENKKFWNMIVKKPLKSWLYFFFRTQSLLMDKVIKNKRGLELVTSRSSGYKTSSEKFLYQLCVIWASLNAVSELFQKLHQQIYASQFMTPYIIPLQFDLLNLESLEREKIINVWISWEWKELFRWNKKHFS